MKVNFFKHFEHGMDSELNRGYFLGNYVSVHGVSIAMVLCENRIYNVPIEWLRQIVVTDADGVEHLLESNIEID